MFRNYWPVSQPPRSPESFAIHSGLHRTSARTRRRGITLLICMLVATVTSVAVLAIFQIARYETLETVSRGNAAQARWLAQGAKEAVIAKLLADPMVRGEFKVELVPGSGQWATVQVTGDDQYLTITATANARGMRHTFSRSFTMQQLKDRSVSASSAAQFEITSSPARQTSSL